MAEIIGPDGKTYFSEDHFKTKTTAATKTKEKAKNILSSFDLHTLTDRVYLIGGGVALLIGLWLLADIAIGLVLLFLGSTGVNYWIMKQK